jgi:hypothetical protein
VALYHYGADDSSEVIFALDDGRILFAGDNVLNDYPTRVWYLTMLKIVTPVVEFPVIPSIRCASCLSPP